MDPITLAIVAGYDAGGTKADDQALVDAYKLLKDLLKRKFGTGSPLAKALDEFEAQPDSPSRKAKLAWESVTAKTFQDSDVLRTATNLIDQIKAQPSGLQYIQNAQKSVGNNIT